MPTLRYALTAAVVPNSAGHYVLYAIGGRNPANRALRRVEAYNASTNRWTRKAPMPGKREGTNGAVVVAGKIYVSGGFDENGHTTGTLYSYTPSTDTWSRKADMPTTSAHGFSAAIDRKIYVVTGWECPDGTCDFSFPRRLYRYTPATNTWARLADPPSWMAIRLGGMIDGKLYLTWGRGGGARPMHVYDPATNRWTTKAAQTDGIKDAICPSAPDVDQCVLVGVAGAVLSEQLLGVGTSFTATGEARSFTVAYDPIANRWTRKTAPEIPRSYAAAGKVKNAAGRIQIVVVGGQHAATGELNGVTAAYTR
jgi:N-acetylneuraminic acid mutarotase